MSKAPGLTEWRLAGRTFTYNRHKVFFREEGKGEPLLLLHGLPTSSWDWRRVWRPLTQRYRVIAPDLLGFGFSDKSRQLDYSLIQQADLVEALLRHLNIHNYHLMAHDFGDSVAMELLSRRNVGHAKQSMLSLCLLNGGIFPELQKTFLIQRLLASPFGWAISYVAHRRLFRRHVQRLFCRPDDSLRPEIDLAYQQLMFNGGRAVLAKLNRHIHERDFHRQRWLRALKETQTPVQFVFGTAEQTSGRATLSALSRQVDADRLIELKEVGYFPHLESPDLVVEALNRFHGKPVTAESWFQPNEFI